MPTLLSFLAGALGALLLALALVFPWFSVPVDFVNGTVCRAYPPGTLLFKFACLAAGGGAAWSFVGSAQARQRAAQGLALLLAALFFFPCCVMAWSPTVAAQASWLQSQHENLSWLGGDIYNAQEYRDSEAKQEVYVADPSRQVGVFKLPNWTPQAVQWGRFPEMVEWLGYSNRFCEFVNKGWFLALGGTVLLLTALCRDRQAADLRLARQVTRLTLAATAVGLVLALTPPMMAAMALTRAREAIFRGDYARSRDCLRTAARWLPVIRQDTYYVAQRGLIDIAQGMDSPPARLQIAIGMEQNGFYTQARHAFLQLIAATPQESPNHREAVRGLLRAAIHELNAGDNPGAATLLEQVLEEEPCNLKANYTLQLALLRLGEFQALKAWADRMTQVYGCFNFRSKTPVLGTMKENLANAAYQQDDPEGALATWRSLTQK